MTKEELKQIYYINKEIIMWQKELNKLQFKSLIKSPEITGLPPGTDIGDRTGNLASEKADIGIVIEGKLKEIQLQRKKIIEYIETIEDSLVRQIILYRHVSLMSWHEIANEIGGGNTDEGVRKIHDRFLDKNL